MKLEVCNCPYYTEYVHTRYYMYPLCLAMVDLRQDMNTQTRKPKTGSPDAIRTEVASQLVARHSTPSGKLKYS